MSPSPAVNQKTRAEWRELGFFYDRVDAPQAWKIVGSRAGLLRFADLLRSYTLDPRNRALSEHEHYGPYRYLEIGTWSERQVNSHWVAGTLSDLSSLEALVRHAIRNAAPGDTIDIGKQYDPKSDTGIILVVASDDFDPAQADSACW